MNRQKILAFNEKKYRSWSGGRGDRERIKKIIKLTGKNKKVLDLGCGIGLIGKKLLENKNTVFGLDISATAVKKAGKNGLIAKKFNLEKNDFPFADNYFDTILAAEIIEHIFDTDTFLKRIKKKLKKGGALIITTPNLASLGRRILLLAGKNPLIETNINKNSAGHIRYFVKKSLFELLQKHKLKIVYFSSDRINFCSSGKLSSCFLSSLFPSLGRTLIVKAVKL